VIEKVVDPLGNETNRQLNKITAQSVDWEDDMNGNRTSYAYDSDGNITSKTDLLGNIWTYAYVVGTDLMETKTNPLGVVTKYEYDGNGNQTRMIGDHGGPLENTTTYAYDSQGNQTTVTDPLGNTTTYEYDANSNLIRVTDSLGNVTTYTYDSRGNKLTETDSEGNIITHTYDLMGRLLSTSDALDNTISYAYDSNGNINSIADPRGAVWTFSYDPYNRLVQETDSMGNTTLYTFDSTDNRTSVTDPLGRVTYFKYGANGKLLKEVRKVGDTQDTIDQDDYVTEFAYDANGNVTAVKDPAGNTIQFEYDELNRVTGTVSPLGNRVDYVYNEVGNRTGKSQFTGNAVNFNYDRLGRIVAYEDSLGSGPQYQYDQGGNKTAIALPDGSTYHLQYDKMNRLTQSVHPDGTDIKISYDGLGRIKSLTNKNGKTETHTYNGRGDLIAKTDSLGNTTYFEYDEVGTLVSITDANGNPTIYTYDKNNNMTSISYADGTTMQFEYGHNGKLRRRINPNGEQIAYEYDDLDRLVKIEYPGSNASSFSYDVNGRIVAADNNYSTVSFSYDADGRLVSRTQDGKTTQYSYDLVNRLLTIVYPSGQTFRESYDRRGRLLSVTDNAGDRIVEYIYDSLDNVKNKVFGNGISGDYSYGFNNLVKLLKYTNSSGEIGLNLQYHRDLQGQLVAIENFVDTQRSQDYQYDAEQRLVEFNRGVMDQTQTVPNPELTVAYDLDFLGNWRSVTKDGLREDRSVNAVNQYLNVSGIGIGYDTNGNLTDDGTYLYEYNEDFRLIEIKEKSTGNVIASYRYDALGYRVKTLTLGVQTEFVYDRDRVVEEYSDGSLDKVYVYGQYLDEIVQLRQGSIEYYLHNEEGLGSVMFVSDKAGNIIEKYEYMPYGAIEISDVNGNSLGQSLVGNCYFFAGGRYDKGSGLYYLRNRYYHVTLGRFLQRDPKGFVDSYNLYEYARSNPINWIDPYGTSSKCIGTENLKFKIGKIGNDVFELAADISGKTCRKCCEACSLRSGDLVTDFSIYVNIKFSAKGEWVPPGWGVKLPRIGYIGVKFTIEAALAAKDITVSSNKCYNRYDGGGCLSLTGKGKAALGSDLKGRRKNIIRVEIWGETGIGGEACITANVTGVMLTYKACFLGAYAGLTVEWWKFKYERDTKDSFFKIKEWCPVKGSKPLNL